MRWLLDTSVCIPLINLMIASIALSHGFSLVTRNTDEFARVPGLDVDRW